MKKYLVSYATLEFEKSREKLVATAKQFGVDEEFSFSPKKIRRTDFYVKNKAILDSARGAGYWLWKSYCILDCLSKMETGDVVFYLDAGVEVIADLTPLYELCASQGGITVFGAHGQVNRTWTKRDCFALMECDAENYWEGEHLSAGFCLFQKSARTIAFVEEWLRFGCNPQIITDAPNTCGLPNLPGFVDHRHDQSILAVLAAKHRLRVFRNPSQWGEKFKDDPRYRRGGVCASPYPAVLNLHRQRSRPTFWDKAKYYLTGS
jgi:hypothetical protein